MNSILKLTVIGTNDDLNKLTRLAEVAEYYFNLKVAFSRSYKQVKRQRTRTELKKIEALFTTPSTPYSTPIILKFKTRLS
jgi:hypothetical protein